MRADWPLPSSSWRCDGWKLWRGDSRLMRLALCPPLSCCQKDFSTWLKLMGKFKHDLKGNVFAANGRESVRHSGLVKTTECNLCSFGGSLMNDCIAQKSYKGIMHAYAWKITLQTFWPPPPTTIGKSSSVLERKKTYAIESTLDQSMPLKTPTETSQPFLSLWTSVIPANL